jgi:hypothetical protein
MEILDPIRKFVSYPWTAKIIAILGGLAYLVQSWRFAHTQISILDEGAYLYKGFLYATGQYTPFQDYGPWGNHMPLSFLIPGYIQTIFEPGLRTGRYLSIALALLMLIGLWILANRLGGRWWAAGAIWAVALNPMFSRIYSNAYSQALVACLFIWILVLIINEKTILWQLFIGSTLTAVLLLTRLNMVLVLPLIIVYIFWQHGRRAGLLTFSAGLLTVIIGHALFWPGIMRLWAAWLPSSLTPFLNTWRGVDTGFSTWNPNPTFDQRWLSFWNSVRFNFIALVGFLGFGLLGFQRKYWKSVFYHRSAVFLSVLLGLLTAAHAWASLGNDYCVYCFQNYLTFFAPAVFLLIIIIFSGWQGGRSTWYVLYASILILLISVGIGYSTSKDLGSAVIEITLPRFKDGQLLAGSITLWGLLENGLGLPYQMTRILIPTLLGLAAGIMILLLAWVINRRKPSNGGGGVNFGLLAIGVFLIAGLILSPTPVLGNGYQDNDCEGDVITAHEEAGQYLVEVIPPGSQVYWQGPESVVPMLYLPGVSIYLPQINNKYSLKLGGNTEEMLRIGLWNDELANKWQQEADFIIVEERKYNSEWKAFLEAGDFDELPRSPTTTPCRDDARLRVFRRITSN